MIMVKNQFGQDPMDFIEETAADRIGRKIREIRTAQNISQAELGEAVGLNADRIQKYENGVRKPKKEMLKKIASALGVSTLALADPVTTNLLGAMFAMFDLEHTFNMKIEKTPDDRPPGLSLSADYRDNIYSYMEEWYKIYTQTQTRLEAALTEEERKEIEQSYRMWQWTFPKSLVDRTERALAKKSIQKQIDRLQQLKDEIDSMDDE